MNKILKYIKHSNNYLYIYTVDNNQNCNYQIENIYKHKIYLFHIIS